MLQQNAVDLIETVDPAIFQVETSTSTGDRVSFLKAHRLKRRGGSFSYLEIGSYLGGSLLPYLLDPACEVVVSIDKRPTSQPDERAIRFVYGAVTTATMIDRLRPFLSLSTMAKLRTIDADMADLSPAAIGLKIDLALIDGEHTVTATFSDFVALLPAMKPDGVVLFHDSNLIIDALHNISCHLRSQCISHRLLLVPDNVAIIALGDSQAVVGDEFAAVALDHRAFVGAAKRKLHEQIAASVAQGSHLELWPA